MKIARIIIEIHIPDTYAMDPDCVMSIGQDLINGGVMVVTAAGASLGIKSAIVIKKERLENAVQPHD